MDETRVKLNGNVGSDDWYKNNIKKKTCCFYVEAASEGICKCGYPKVQHCDDAIKPAQYLGKEWSHHKHIREEPTDAYGVISFGGLGQKLGKYVRISSATPPEHLYQLMTKQWELRLPNLLISVTGGAKNFGMKSQLKDKFRRGLIKVAQTTDAWILTGGTHTGVMKHVGMAVQDSKLSSSSMEGQIVVIGVVTWGIIHNRQELINPEPIAIQSVADLANLDPKAKGCFTANYSLDEQNQGRLSCLDENHTHFLLVDDGTHGRYGGEIELRARLEKLISEQPLEKRISEQPMEKRISEQPMEKRISEQPMGNRVFCHFPDYRHCFYGNDVTLARQSVDFMSFLVVHAF
ncbi:transient receptor potential cation channel subfamily M member 2-like [Misgurnus anguillicaudatus]|uniref:transient receptor potential cation channel subfamily M member 2-like n=1 Tax=Misgurnus anguillicaudatus TaxID=75329 RepID=UPI003CCF0AB6